MEGAVDPTWGEAFEVAPLSDEEDVPDPYTDEQVDAAFYDPLSEAALQRRFRRIVGCAISISRSRQVNVRSTSGLPCTSWNEA